MKLILDTNIYISIILFDKSLEALYLKIISNIDNNCYFSKQTWLELETKINSPKISKLIDLSKRQISRNQVVDYLNNIEINSILITEISSKVNLSRDPKDSKFLELAAEIEADYLVTGDNDLLELKNFNKTRIVKPAQFLSELG